jgi:hypothetical protein
VEIRKVNHFFVCSFNLIVVSTLVDAQKLVIVCTHGSRFVEGLMPVGECDVFIGD